MQVLRTNRFENKTIVRAGFDVGHDEYLVMVELDTNSRLVGSGSLYVLDGTDASKEPKAFNYNTDLNILLDSLLRALPESLKEHTDQIKQYVKREFVKPSFLPNP